ncbi:NAD-dependent epimerase/dehydratase family protein [Luminiphilus sp.]|nr:NAD-dependent epimerase/dehydratase family protein [Luminiphilus sp.]
MMPTVAKVAILGPNGLIGRELIASLKKNDAMSVYPVSQKRDTPAKSITFESFMNIAFDAIINCRGVGDPSQIRLHPDTCVESHLASRKLVMDYLEKHEHLDPLCLFISSGGIFNRGIASNVDERENVRFRIESLESFDAYRLAKLLVECLNRAESERSIVDVRIFGFVSASFSNQSSFFINELFQCVKNERTLSTDKGDFLRDYVTAEDIALLISHLLRSKTPKINCAINLLSKRPISKFEILDFFKNEFGLRYRVDGVKEQLGHESEDIFNALDFRRDPSTFLGIADSKANIASKYIQFERLSA